MNTNFFVAEDEVFNPNKVLTRKEMDAFIGDRVMLSRLVDTFFSRTSWTMLLYAENHSISVA